MAGDPFFDQVEILLRMEGSDGGTTFTDESQYAHTIQVFGDAQTTTSIKQYGVSSLTLDGTNDYLRCDFDSRSTAYDLPGDFTFEGWANVPASGAGNGALFGRGSTGNIRYALFYNDNDGGISFFVDAFSKFTPMVTGNFDLRGAGFTHLAVTRCENDWFLFINGGLPGTTNFRIGQAATIAPSIMALLHVGADPQTTPSRDWNVEIDDFRFTQGICRYKAPFTPPGELGTSPPVIIGGLGFPGLFPIY